MKFLSDAFDSALNDPELLEIAQNSGRPINHASGEEMSRIVIESMAMPDDIRELFVGAVQGEI